MASSYLQPLTGHVYWSLPDPVRDRPIMGAVCGERSTFVVEAGASPANAAQFLEALQALDRAPARLAAVTHWHWDHVFGIHALGLPVIAHRETRRRVAEMAGLDWRDAPLDARVAAGEESPFIADHVKVEMTDAERAALVIAPPDVIIDDRLEIDLGGVTCQVIHVGGDHARDSSVVCVPEDRLAFLGDCLYNGSIRGEYYYTTARLYPLLDALLGLEADVFLLSHQEEPMTRSQLEKEAGLFHHIGDLVEQTRDRAATLSRLPALLGEPLNDDHLFNVDSFLRGLQGDIED